MLVAMYLTNNVTISYIRIKRGNCLKIEIVKEKGFQLLLKLFQTAVKDGEIDSDEGKIIEKTDSNMNQLYDCVNKAWEDNVIDDEEKQCIITLLQRIQLDAENIALSDDNITQEEADLLLIIDKMLEEFLELEG